jgi:hypothetical protein
MCENFVPFGFSCESNSKRKGRETYVERDRQKVEEIGTTRKERKENTVE